MLSMLTPSFPHIYELYHIIQDKNRLLTSIHHFHGKLASSSSVIGFQIQYIQFKQYNTIKIGTNTVTAKQIQRIRHNKITSNVFNNFIYIFLNVKSGHILCPLIFLMSIFITIIIDINVNQN